MSFTPANVSEQTDANLPEKNEFKAPTPICKNDVTPDHSADYDGNLNGTKLGSTKNQTLSCKRFLVDWFGNFQVPNVAYYVLLIECILICLYSGWSILYVMAWKYYWNLSNKEQYKGHKDNFKAVDQRVLWLDEFGLQLIIFTICLVFLSVWAVIVCYSFRRFQPKERFFVI